MAISKKASTRTRRASGAKKQATKKVVKKTTAKKVAAKKSTQKKAAKKTTKKVTKKSSKPTTPKLRPTKKDTFTKKGGPLAFPRSISLALFTPMLPMNPEQIAAGVARLAGAAFVLVGVFFSGFNSMKLGSLFSQLNLGQNCTAGGCTYTYAQGQPASLASALDGFGAFFARPLHVPAEVVMRIDLICLSLAVIISGLLLVWLSVHLRTKKTEPLLFGS